MGKGSRVMSMLVLGVIVVILMLISQFVVTWVSLPILLSALFGGITDEMASLFVLIMLVIVSGIVFTLAGFRRK